MQAQVKTSINESRIQNAKLPVAGKIRPGIMILTKAAVEQIPDAKKIYDDNVAAGKTFEEIEKLLKQANPKFQRSPLTPKNTDYFRCNQQDFVTPGAADSIVQRYGEDRGHGPRLYSFPVMFPVNEIKHVFRQQFESWTARARQNWSEPDVNGNLQCMRLEEIKPDKSRRKRFGGRATETVGPCDPNQCDAFGRGACSHHATLCFYIPGCTGVGVIELPFTSIYASMGIQKTLDMVNMGLGKIKGAHNGLPIFQLSKRNENVSRIDWETGKAERSNQWIIRLEAINVDMTDVFIAEERRALSLPPTQQSTSTAVAVAVPQSVPRTTIIEHADEPIDEPEQAEPAFDEKKMIAQLRQDVSTKAEQFGISVENLSAYGKRKYGERAFVEIDSLDAILNELQYASDTGDISLFTK